MKLIYHSPPVAASFDVPRQQNPIGRVDGYLTFCVYLCESGEELPQGHPAGRPLAHYRAAAGGAGKPILIQRSSFSRLGSMVPATFTVPESVLQGLPDDALLRFAWAFGGKSPSDKDAAK